MADEEITKDIPNDVLLQVALLVEKKTTYQNFRSTCSFLKLEMPIINNGLTNFQFLEKIVTSIKFNGTLRLYTEKSNKVLLIQKIISEAKIVFFKCRGSLDLPLVIGIYRMEKFDFSTVITKYKKFVESVLNTMIDVKYYPNLYTYEREVINKLIDSWLIQLQ